MAKEPLVIPASLVVGDEQVPVEATCLSKYSLMVRFPPDKAPAGDLEIPKLVVELQDKKVEVGPLRLILEPNNDGFTGRLVGARDVYDFESLLSKQEVVKSQTVFGNLPIILAHKKAIRPSFKSYTSDLTYDLNVYKSIFDGCDADYSGEPPEVKRLLQQALIDSVGRQFLDFLDERLAELENLVADFERDEHRFHGFYFRKQLWNFITSVPFMARTNLRPRGYCGDSMMMRMIYENDYQGDSTFARLMHKHPVEHPAAEAVRSRRRLISQTLRCVENEETSASGDRIRVLSLACGPAAELEDVLSCPEECARFNFTLLDQDEEALAESASLIDRLQAKSTAPINVQYVCESVRRMLATPHLDDVWGQFHFIYSMGLFDYLTPPVARAVLGKLYELLLPDGEMLIGNFHVSNPSKVYMEYWLDWVLYYRTEGEFLDLLAGANPSQASVSFEDTGSQMFLHVKK